MSQELFDELAKDKPDHNIFSPSGSKRWLSCHGWYQATKDLPYIPSGAAAQRGTEIHAIMERCIIENEHPENITDDPMAVDHVGYVLDHINAYKSLYPTVEIYSEVYIPYKNIEGQQLGGTIDVIGIVDQQELMLADLKTGVGIVEVNDNSQLLNYAVAGRLHLGRFERYRMVIIQPAVHHEYGPIREIVFTNEDLDTFEKQVEQAIIANLNGGERTPGEHCRYCKAEAICKPRSIYALNKAGLSLADFIKELS